MKLTSLSGRTLTASSDLNVEPIKSNENLVCTNAVEHKELNEVNNNNDIGLQSDFGSKHGSSELPSLKDNLVQYGDSESLISLLQPSGGLPHQTLSQIRYCDIVIIIILFLFSWFNYD